MLANTGTVSFLLYGFFIIVSIIGFFAAMRLILKGNVESQKLDKIIELFKYTIVSIAITTSTLIITDLFKERDQDLKELQYFENANMIKAEDIEARLSLAKYLSIVAPSGEMKESWKNYYDSVRVEYKEYQKLKNKLDSILKINENEPHHFIEELKVNHQK